ncbi:AsmA family protein [Siculibacillus lacustris]|uniref:AsmA family protein n=1 Tax=Siculibacillus lacustris TaxID=1549641 RepID=A0A4V2KTU0_9HYPH|nr:AsmA family protein [Siculibacillus lacustris]TBW38690.1 AsmA family protein [Siculibacillus lacustris]
MNSLYIGVGVTIIVVLLTALIGPFFIDWTAHRDLFEREIGRIVGAQTRILGDVEARLLPSPRLRFADVVIGPVDTPLLRIGRFELDLEAAPLIKGEIRVAETRLERPAVDIAIAADGRPVLPAAQGLGGLGAASVDLIEISDGRFTLSDLRSGERYEVSRIAATGATASLAGPWKFDGGAVVGSRAVAFRLAAAAAGDGGLGLKIQAGAADDPASAALDAVVRIGERGLTLTGSLTAERREALAGVPAALGGGFFHLDAQIAGTPDAIEATGIALAVGPEEKAAQFTGDGRVTLGRTPRLEARLAAKQIDLDRLAAREDTPRADPARLIGDLITGLSGLGEGTAATRLRLDVQGLVIGGGVVQELGAEVVGRPGGLALEKLEARLPGRARLDLSGRVATAGGPRFEGRAELSAEQPALLAAWWRGRPIPGERFDPVSLAGEVAIAADRLSGEGLALKVGTATARGRFGWTRGAALSIAASADRLEFDQLARLGRLFFDEDGAGRPAALEVDLDAGALVVGGIAARTVGIRARASDETLAIDRLSVADFAGARLEGSGRIDRPTTVPDGSIDLTIVAARPEAAVRAVAGLFGDAALVDRAVGIAALAAPLDLRLKLAGRASGNAASDVAFTAEGRAAGATLAVDGRYAGRIDDPVHATVKARASLDGAAPTGALARALGPVGAKGRIAVAVTADGVAAGEGLTIDASASLGAGRIATGGRLRIADGGVEILDGRASVASPDATGLAALAGRPLLAIERRLPLDVSLKLAGVWPKLAISDLAGRIDAAAVRASGTVDLGRRPAAVAGSIELDRVDVATLAGLVLGEGASADGGAGGAVWSDAALAEPAFAGIADLAVTVAAGRAALSDTVALDHLRFALDARAGRTRIRDLAAGFAGGTFAGEIAVDRDERSGTRIDGRASLSGVSLEEIGWRNGDRPVASGRIGGDATFATTGRSAAAMVAGLSGQGNLRLDGVRVAGIGIDALSATAVAADSGAATTPDEIEKVFRARMAASATQIERAEAPFAMEAGVARSGRIAVETPAARISGRMAVDLPRGALDADWTLEPLGKAAEGTRTPISKATPSAGITLRGPIDRPQVRFDVAPLAAYLTLRSFERDIDRVETLQQDIVERQRFARERRRLEEIRQEEERARKAQEAETLRRAQEAEAARRAEAQRRAQEAEAARRAAQAPPPPAPAPVAPPPAPIAPAPAPIVAPAPIAVPPTSPASAAPNPPVPSPAASPAPNLPPPAVTAPLAPTPTVAAPASDGAVPTPPSAAPAPIAGSPTAPSPVAAAPPPAEPPPLPPMIRIAPAPSILGSGAAGSGGSTGAPMTILPPGVQPPP